ncbi:MAG: aspartyl beta-hydroxylase [Caulobacter sp.]|nr:aspartyl beta-hydroxylase [Caulobacter sp.]
MERLLDRLAVDPALAERLDAADDADFARRAAAEVDLGESEADAALRDPALRSARLPGATPPPGWLPVGLDTKGDEPVVEWAWFGRKRLLEPFYDESVALRLHRPINRLPRPRSPLSALVGEPMETKLTGLVFHMSRCGSTLTAQMLAAPSAHAVVAEGPPIDAVVRMEGLAPEAHAALLRAIVAAFGRRRTEAERRLFLKLDSWHVPALPLFRRAFPDTPWVFLHRDPVEVLVSHAHRPGLHMIADLVTPQTWGLEADGQTFGDDYRARVLGAACRAALEGHARGGGLVVGYPSLPGAVLDHILPHFGVEIGPEERAVMVAAGGRDAKAVHAAFVPDAAAKQRAASQGLRAACARHADEPHRALAAVSV